MHSLRSLPDTAYKSSEAELMVNPPPCAGQLSWPEGQQHSPAPCPNPSYTTQVEAEKSGAKPARCRCELCAADCGPCERGHPFDVGGRRFGRGTQGRRGSAGARGCAAGGVRPNGIGSVALRRSVASVAYHAIRPRRRQHGLRPAVANICVALSVAMSLEQDVGRAALGHASLQMADGDCCSALVGRPC